MLRIFISYVRIGRFIEFFIQNQWNFDDFFGNKNDFSEDSTFGNGILIKF